MRGTDPDTARAYGAGYGVPLEPAHVQTGDRRAGVGVETHQVAGVEPHGGAAFPPSGATRARYPSPINHVHVGVTTTCCVENGVRM